MKPSTITALFIAGIIAFVGIFAAAYVISTYNGEASLKVLYEAKVKANNAEFDNMWKKINQTAQVPVEQKNALKEIFTSYAAARTGTGSANGGGSLANWVKESVPNVDTKTFENLQNIIAGARDSWTARQVELVDISRQYNQALAVFPSNFILKMFGFQPVDPAIVTSSRTEKAFQTGKDDDTELPH